MLYLSHQSMLEPTVVSANENRRSQSYVFNPKSPTPAVGGPSFNPANCGPRDQRRFEQRNDVLIFSTDPIQEEIEICGTVRLFVYVSTSAASTDFVGRLCDVFPSGISVNVCEGIIRIEKNFERTVYSTNSVS